MKGGRVQVHEDTRAIVFSDDVATFPGQIAELLTRAVTATHGLAQVEPLVMGKLFWAEQPKMQSVHPLEPAAAGPRERVHALWTQAVAPLAEYKALFAAFEPLIARDNEAAVRELASKGAELTLADVRGALQEAQRTLAALQTDIPASVRSVSQTVLPVDTLPHAHCAHAC